MNRSSAEERGRTRRYIERLDRARATLRDEVNADADDYLELSMEKRGDLLVRLCDAARMILESRTDRDAVLAYQDPPAADFEAKWSALLKRYRASRTYR